MNLIVTDIKGYFYIYNINKNLLVNQFKIHDSAIMNFKISPNRITSSGKNTYKSLIYSIDSNGILKIFELNSGEEIKSAKLLKEGKGKILFDIDDEEKLLVFSKNTKIKLLSLDSLTKKNPQNIKSLIVNIGMHSQEITSLKFSSDSRFILSSTVRDYIVSVWHLKNKETPLFTFQNQIFPLENFMIKINKGTYHAVSLNREMISIYRINLKEIDPNEPLRPLFIAKFPQKNLLKINYEDLIFAGKNKDIIDYNTLENLKNSDKVIQAIYGNLIKCEIKSINYSPKGDKDDVKEMEISIKLKEDNINQENKSKNKNVIVNPNNLKILNEVEMSKLEAIDSQGKEKEDNKKFEILVEKEEENKELTNKDTKISLLNIIRNSLINNDFNQFEWALDQKVS